MKSHYQINLGLIYSRLSSLSNLLDVTLKVTTINESQGGGGYRFNGKDLNDASNFGSSLNR